MKRTLQQQQEQQQSSAGNAVTIDDNGERDSVTPSRRSSSKPTTTTTTTTTMLASRGDYSNAPLDDVNVDDVLADGTPQYETLGKLQEGNIEFELAMHTSRQRGEATGESSPLSVELALFVRQLPTASEPWTMLGGPHTVLRRFVSDHELEQPRVAGKWQSDYVAIDRNRFVESLRRGTCDLIERHNYFLFVLTHGRGSEAKKIAPRSVMIVPKRELGAAMHAHQLQAVSASAMGQPTAQAHRSHGGVHPPAYGGGGGGGGRNETVLF